MFFNVYGCFAYVCVPYGVPGAMEARRGIRSPRVRVTASVWSPCGSWELNLGPLEEKSALSTIEPSPASSKVLLVVVFFKKKKKKPG